MPLAIKPKPEAKSAQSAAGTRKGTGITLVVGGLVVGSSKLHVHDLEWRAAMRPGDKVTYHDDGNGKDYTGSILAFSDGSDDHKYALVVWDDGFPKSSVRISELEKIC
jgi:hypothetical protein